MGIPRYDDIENLKKWLEPAAQRLAMVVDPDRPLYDLAPWVYTGLKFLRMKKGDDGVMVPDRRFFEIIGGWIKSAGGREVPWWMQLFIREYGKGHIAILIDEDDYVLLRAKGEPGTSGIVVNGVNTRVSLTPTCQFSDGNFKSHNEDKKDQKDVKPVPFAELAGRTNVTWARVITDPGRFWEKVNLVTSIRTTRTEAEHQAEATGQVEDFVWVHMRCLHKLGVLQMLNNFVFEAIAMALLPE